MMRKNGLTQSGFTLVELIIFIVVISISAVSLLGAMRMVLRTSHTAQEHGAAVYLASQCLEWYEGQSRLQGYSSIACPSNTVPSFCAGTDGLNTAVQVSCTTLNNDTSAHYKTVTVTVNGSGSAQLSLLLADDGT